MDNLTERQKRFIDYYIQTGNQSEAARMAGYKKPHVQGAQNYEKLRKEIDLRLKNLERGRIAQMQEINEFWTRVVRGEEKEEQAEYNPKTEKVEVVKVAPALKDRIKASELRAKVEGAFLERHEIKQVESGWFKDG